MIDDEENFTAAAYEVEIMQLWDQLPDHAKTISLIQRIKQIASIECQEVVSKLAFCTESRIYSCVTGLFSALTDKVPKSVGIEYGK